MKKIPILLLSASIIFAGCSRQSIMPTNTQPETEQSLTETQTTAESLTETPAMTEAATSDNQAETVPVTSNQETLRQVEITDLEENDTAEIGAECFAEYGIIRDEDNYCSIQLNSKPIISAQSGSDNKIELYLRLMDRMKGTIRKVTIGEYLSDMPTLEDTSLFTFRNDVIMACRAGDTYIIVTYDKASIAVYESSVATPIKDQQPVKILEFLEKDL